MSLGIYAKDSLASADRGSLGLLRVALANADDDRVRLGGTRPRRLLLDRQSSATSAACPEAAGVVRSWRESPSASSSCTSRRNTWLSGSCPRRSSLILR